MVEFVDEPGQEIGEPKPLPINMGDWLINLNQTLASLYVTGIAQRRGKVVPAPVVEAYVDGYMRACEDFAVSGEAKTSMLKMAGVYEYYDPDLPQYDPDVPQ